ncbi:hypothetical protein [Niallia sp. 01092]|uniref:hypothetical protein n=1 Tax=unclassified Niallia TaxID=2837522 RepID=UPI003FD1844A
MKKNFIFLTILFILISIVLVYLFKSDIDYNTKIKNNEGSSISYLSEEDKVPVLKVFNFNQEKLTKKYKIKKEQDLYSSTFYSGTEKKTVVITQQLEPYGYQVFVQTQDEIKKIGNIKEAVHEVVFADNYLYALVYSPNSIKGVNLKKYKITDLEKPIKTWSIEGNPERMLIDQKLNKIYILTVNNNTLLYSLDYKIDNLQNVKLLNRAFDLNATIDNGQLWLLLRETLENQNDKSKNKNKESKIILQYDIEKQEFINKINTEYQPKFMQLDNNQIYIISGTPNSSYLEQYDKKNLSNTKKEVIKLKADNINGFIHKKYIFSNKGVYKIEDGNVKQIIEENVSPNIDLVIH